MLEFLTDGLRAALLHCNLNKVYELRVRAGKPVVCNYGGAYTYLGARGVCPRAGGALTASVSDIEQIISPASEYYVYSVTEQLRQGFLTGAGGERIGLAGVFVYEGGESFAVRDVTSLNIRVPHEVIGCADAVFRRCFSAGLCSVLVLSPPGRGKTTILRDLARQIGGGGIVNILLSDERGEISAANRDFSLDVGACTDVIRFSGKKDALTAAVRAMRPDLIITDEVVSSSEIEALAACVRGGVAVVASAHCKDAAALLASPVFARAAEERLFDYYVQLSSRGVGQVEQIFNAALAPVGTC